jgi:hypothetical protein
MKFIATLELIRIVHFFSSVVYTFGYLEQKLLGRLWKCLFFLKSNFYVSENFKFQCDPFSNKKRFFTKVQLPPMSEMLEMAYFMLGYFSTKLGTSVDGQAWKNNKSESFNEIAQEINGNVKNLYHGKCTGKRDFTLQNFLFWQNMCRILKFLTAEKIRFKKKQTFSRSAQ